MDLRLATRLLGLVAALFVCLAFLSSSSAAASTPVGLGDGQPAISQDKAEQIAENTPDALAAKREHPDLQTVSERQDSGNFQVGFTTGGKEVVQVVVDDQTGLVLESWTGYQVAWKMARGYPGAFGRKINAPYVWIPLCLIFLGGLFDWRRPRRLANLDLLVIVAGFGVSHFFFNRGEIGLSVPLAYPALLYLMARALWLGFRGGEGWRPAVPVTWLAIAVLFLVGFRVGLNMADSNVIDVGYSGVVGADRIADGEQVYDNFPANDQSGDTYGPVAYYSYIPFEQIFPWSGNWDDLPAAHAAAIFFDLVTAAGLFFLGRRLRPGEAGNTLGVTMAFAWAACPYTAFALESNTNDGLVAMFLVLAMLALTSPVKRGIALGLAGMTKFAPLILAPLFATYVSPASGGAKNGRPSNARSAGRPFFAPTGPAGKTVGLFTIAFVATIGIVLLQTMLNPGLSTFWDRTVGFQAGRNSPFSIWGQTSLEPLHIAIEVLVVALALLVAFRPRVKDPYVVAALGAALIIGFELTVDHWFYLYIPWFLALLVLPLSAGVDRGAARERARGSARPSQPAPAR